MIKPFLITNSKKVKHIIQITILKDFSKELCIILYWCKCCPHSSNSVYTLSTTDPKLLFFLHCKYDKTTKCLLHVDPSWVSCYARV